MALHVDNDVMFKTHRIGMRASTPAYYSSIPLLRWSCHMQDHDHLLVGQTAVPVSAFFFNFTLCANNANKVQQC